MRILVTGSRDWDDEQRVIKMLDHYYFQQRRGEEPSSTDILVHGACPTGADEIAHRWAVRTGLTPEPHPADWEKHGKKAGFVRNAEMVELGADVCFAFIRNGSKGATMTADLAERARIQIYRCFQHDPI